MRELLKSIQWTDLVVLIFFSFGMVITIMTFFVGLMFFFKKMFTYRNAHKVTEVVDKKIIVSKSDISAYDTVAIATTIHLYFNDLHDQESGIITIKQRQYSRWK
jgi:hypothetical protein